jgi:dihydroorotate dehydrogenase (NAD+) catalytic subunit
MTTERAGIDNDARRFERSNEDGGALRLGGKLIRGRFVIPSGIRCTHASVIEKCFAEIDSIGVITTKSISVQPRAGYREPIYARYSPGSYVNAVGLSNPGARAFREELAGIRIPSDKFLLVSIFGGSAAEFVEAASILDPVADGFELNMSCPHAAGYGLQIGQDPALVASITREVASTVRKPVIVKLSATIPGLAKTAGLALEAGAAGITVSNTIGPSLPLAGETPVLNNRFGGMSGDAIRPLALWAVHVIRQAVGPAPLIIGMGGIGTAEHVAQFRTAGADLFGIGSALTGLDTAACRVYFDTLQRQIESGEPLTLLGDSPDSAVSMAYHRVRVVARRPISEHLFELELDRLPGNPLPGDLSGRYFFLRIPSVGEKPFAIYSVQRRAVVVRIVGQFTRALAEIPEGGELWLRGPYGRPFTGTGDCREYILAGGGTGIASLTEIAWRLKDVAKLSFLLGARSGSELFGAEELQRLGNVVISTDDGSQGCRGNVSELLERFLAGRPKESFDSVAFVNCGPAAMIDACAKIESRYVPDERIIAAVEYQTSCGVGICGKCASPSGHLSCIDGPFMPIGAFRSRGGPEPCDRARCASGAS